MPSLFTNASSSSSGSCSASFGLACLLTILEVCTLPSVAQYQKNNCPPMTPIVAFLKVFALVFVSISIPAYVHWNGVHNRLKVCLEAKEWPRSEGKWSRSSSSRSSLERKPRSSPRTACISTRHLLTSSESINIAPWNRPWNRTSSEQPLKKYTTPEQWDCKALCFSVVQNIFEKRQAERMGCNCSMCFFFNEKKNRVTLI